MTNLQGQYKNVEQTYGQDVLNLALAKGYHNHLIGVCHEPPHYEAQSGSLD